MRQLIRQPVLQFFAIGLALYCLSAIFASRREPASYRIVVTDGQLDALIAGFERRWRRPPSQAELRDAVDEYVREEVLVREAMARALDRDDPLVRRRLRQKLESLATGPLDAKYHSLRSRYRIVIDRQGSQ